MPDDLQAPASPFAEIYKSKQVSPMTSLGHPAKLILQNQKQANTIVPIIIPDSIQNQYSIQHKFTKLNFTDRIFKPKHINPFTKFNSHKPVFKSKSKLHCPNSIQNLKSKPPKILPTQA